MFKIIYVFIFMIIFHSKDSYAASYTRMIIYEGGGIFGFIKAIVGIIIIYIIGYSLLYIISFLRIKNSKNNKITIKELTDKSIDIYIKTCTFWYFVYIPFFTIIFALLFVVVSLLLSILIADYNYGNFPETILYLYFIFSAIGPIIYAIIKAVEENNIE